MRSLRVPPAAWFALFAVMTFVLSRLPFLLATPDWKPFGMEHCFFTSVPFIADRLQDLSPLADTRLGSIAEQHFGWHYHGGAGWIGWVTRQIQRLTGNNGLLSLRVVGLLHSSLAVALWAGTLATVWTGHRARLLVALAVAWLVPPTMYLWSTVMPMGHFMDTWFFHGLALPALLLLASNRLPLWLPLVLGLGSGLATVYTLSNLAFPALFTLLIVLMPGIRSTRRWSSVATIWAITLSSVAVFFLQPTRRQFISVRLEAGLPEGSAAGVLERIGAAVSALLGPSTVYVGDILSLRGAFSLLETAPEAPAQRVTAYLALGLFLAGAIPLILSGLRALGRSRYAALSVEERFLAANGVLFVIFLSAWLLIAPGREAGLASYFLMVLPPAWLGVAWLLARPLAASARGVRVSGGVVLTGALGLLMAGYVSSASANLRDVGRPPLERCDPEQINSVALPTMGTSLDAMLDGFTEACLAVYPGDAMFCDYAAWMNVSRQALPDLGRRCHERPPTEAMHCAATRGLHRGFDGECSLPAEPLTSRTPLPRDCCPEFEGALLEACMSGTQQWGLHFVPEPPQLVLSRLCRDTFSDEPGRLRRCLEGNAHLAAGMPPLPSRPTAASGTCWRWPTLFTGVCELAAQDVPTSEAPSCEDVYRTRYATTVPERHSLMHQQCLRMEGSYALAGTYAPCAIGVARALDGLECTWDGGTLDVR